MQISSEFDINRNVLVDLRIAPIGIQSLLESSVIFFIHLLLVTRAAFAQEPFYTDLEGGDCRCVGNAALYHSPLRDHTRALANIPNLVSFPSSPLPGRVFVMPFVAAGHGDDSMRWLFWRGRIDGDVPAVFGRRSALAYMSYCENASLPVGASPVYLYSCNGYGNAAEFARVMRRHPSSWLGSFRKYELVILEMPNFQFYLREKTRGSADFSPQCLMLDLPNTYALYQLT